MKNRSPYPHSSSTERRSTASKRDQDAKVTAPTADQTAVTLAAIADSTGEAERQRLDGISPQTHIGLDGMQSYRPSFDLDSFSKTFANKTDAERDAADAAFTAKFGKSLEKVASEQLSGSDLDNVLNLIKRRDGDVVGQRERD